MNQILQKMSQNRPTHEFEYQGITVTVREYAPGIQSVKRGTALIKLHKEIIDAPAEDKRLSDLTEQEFSDIQKRRETNEQSLRDNFRECVELLDGEDASWLTDEIIKEYFSFEFMNECVDFAMGNSTPVKEGEETEVDRFHQSSDEQGE